MTNSNQLDFHEPTLQQVADLCSQFGFTCAGEADLACLRAVLREGFSRWGRPAPAPAGEVAELVAELRRICFDVAPSDSDQLTRAADLLRHQAADVDALRGRLSRAISLLSADLLERQAAPAPAGEVAELVALIRQISLAWEPEACLLGNMTAGQLTRAAALLEQRHPAPVPVSERLPGPEDYDAEGRCWLLTMEDGYPQWRLHSIEGNQPGGATMIWVPVDSFPGVMVDAFYTSHWLPATALPLPEGEVE